jgi:hypothetical protein
MLRSCADVFVAVCSATDEILDGAVTTSCCIRPNPILQLSNSVSLVRIVGHANSEIET